MSAVLELHEVFKSFPGREHEVEVLRNVSFTLEDGQTAAIVGPSGSGKTTLLSLCAGLDRADRGHIHLLGHDLDRLSEDQRAILRNNALGFIFQSFHLMPSLTALENVMLPMELRGGAGARRNATDLLTKVGLGERLGHYPSQLSGGEQQRVAIARAFINQPRILFADEPTGNLDRETSANVTELLFELNREQGTALLLITHDVDLARHAQRRFRLDAGILTEEFKTTGSQPSQRAG